MVHVSKGVLIQSDEPTIEFIKHVDEQTANAGGARFIIECIDPQRVFVQSSALELIQKAIRARDRRNTYEKVDVHGAVVQAPHDARPRVRAKRKSKATSSKK